MTYIIDASIAIKWIAPEVLREQALAMLTHISELEAPDLILPEVTNVAWKKCVRGELSREQAASGVLAIRRYVQVFHSSETLYERAMTMAFALDHPAYDCFYLACAEIHDGVMVTADRRFCDTVRTSQFARLIRHVGDVPPAVPP